jgi:hypothetical protein
LASGGLETAKVESHLKITGAAKGLYFNALVYK